MPRPSPVSPIISRRRRYFTISPSRNITRQTSKQGLIPEMKLAVEGLAAGWMDDRGGGRVLGWVAEPSQRQLVHRDNYKMLLGSVCPSVGSIGLAFIFDGSIFNTGGAGDSLSLPHSVRVGCPFFLCLQCFKYIVKAIKIEIVLGAVSEGGREGTHSNPTMDCLIMVCMCVCVQRWQVLWYFLLFQATFLLNL